MSITELIAKSGTIRRGARDPERTGGLVWQIQSALNAAGAALGLDGDYGRATETAVIRYKAAHGYAATGDVGPLTAALLDKELAKAASVPAPVPQQLASGAPPWLVINRAITGTKEFPGGADNPVILHMASSVGERFPELANYMKGYTHDSIPWCGLEQAYCVAKAGFKPPAEALYATNWAEAWADGVRLKEPALGAIMVKTRDGGGHVTEYEGEDENYWFCRGGNQSDMINVARFPKATTHIVGWMWPKGYPLPTGGRVHTTFNAATSVKEA